MNKIDFRIFFLGIAYLNNFPIYRMCFSLFFLFLLKTHPPAAALPPGPLSLLEKNAKSHKPSSKPSPSERAKTPHYLAGNRHFHFGEALSQLSRLLSC